VNPFGDPRKLMKQVQEMQERMQQEVAALRVEATSGGGMVKVAMTGEKKLESLTIDPQVVSKDDVEMLQDLILAAIHEAMNKVDAELKDKIGGMTGGMKIPGLF
jgi:DNA-binding YbaB/EbfC family protein